MHIGRAVLCLAGLCGLVLGTPGIEQDHTSTTGAGPTLLCRHDVSVLTILAPRDTVDSGTTHTPRAIIRNVGDFPEVFPVTLLVANGYSAAVQCTLAVGQTDTVSFTPNWLAHPVGSYWTLCYSSLVGDQNRRNDTACGRVVVINPGPVRHDVGAITILAPVGQVDSGTVHTPRAIIHNFGTRAETFPVTFRIGTGYLQSQVRSLDPGETDTIIFPSWTAQPVGLHATACYTQLTIDEDRSNDTATSSVQVLACPRHDVGTISIVWPVGLVDSGTTEQPRAVITNYGNRGETFQVTLRIGSIYRDSLTTSLAVGETATVSFSSWTAQPIGHYSVIAYTQLATDEGRSNDTARAELCVIPRTQPRHDVGAIEILAPTGSVVFGTAVTPRARVGNFGDSTEVFPVTLLIDPSYSRTVACTLASAQTRVLTFPNWTAGPLGRREMTCYTALGRDGNRSNDTVTGSVEVVQPPRHDVSAIAILAPVDTVDSGTVHTPSAVIANLGNRIETFPVTMEIGSGYSRTLPGVTLNPGDTTTLYFPSWTATLPGVHATTCYASLLPDENRLNDTVRNIVVVRPPRPDVGAIAILAPADTVDSGTVITPVAVIHRFSKLGDEPFVTFPVTMVVGANYRRTIDVTMPSVGIDTVSFDPVWIAEPVGLVRCTCYTSFAEDPNRANDTAAGFVVVVRPAAPPRHDVGTTAIIAPADTVDSGSIHSPTAVVQNFGNRTETFSVTFIIGSTYSRTIQHTLNPGQVDTVFFPFWLASPPGYYPTTCYTGLGPDEDRSNDTAYGYVVVVDTAAPPRHDVGAFAILAPVDTVDSGSVQVPTAVIRNLGNRLEVFPVTFRIGGLYNRTVNRTLVPGQIDTVEFGYWVAVPSGRYEVECYTRLGFDEDRSNDTTRDSVVIINRSRHDVGAIAIIVPVDTVDSGSVHTPTARVTNFGNRVETFPVTFTIGGTYSSTVPAVTLNPDDTTTLYFPSWTASTPGSFATICYTSMVPDENRLNDTVRGVVVVVDTAAPPRHDVGAVAVLSPIGTVDSGSIHTPRAAIRNFGNRTETFPVFFNIGNVYADSARRTLLPGQTDTVSFSFWIAQPPDSYPVVCFTRLDEDEDRTNDTAYALVVVVDTAAPPRHDVGATAILEPTGTVDSNSVHTPRAVVQNFGNRNETFPVTLTIGTGYSETMQTSLAVGAVDTVVFPFWRAQAPGQFATVCYTALADDENRLNDTVRSTVQVNPMPPPDVGAIYILAPVGLLDSGTTLTPQVVVRHFGEPGARLPGIPSSTSDVIGVNRRASAAFLNSDFGLPVTDYNITFPVALEIGSIYRETTTVTLPAYGIDTVSFPAWTATALGAVNVTGYTYMTGDPNRLNDTARAEVNVRSAARHDVGAVTIIAPAGDVGTGASVAPRAVVRNYGTRAELFPVTLTIGSEYVGAVVESLEVGASDTVSFPLWSPTSVGTKPVTCYTALLNDENRSNDTVRSEVRVVAADVACLEILAPVGTVESGSITTPVAVVKNLGPDPATFPVTMNIAGGYSWPVQVSLDAGGVDTLSFPSWTAVTLGAFDVVCYTALVGDPNPANDTARTRVEVAGVLHDVGVEAVLSPTGRAAIEGQPWTTRVSPRARVVNHTAQAEPAFDARFVIAARRVSGSDTSWSVVYDKIERVASGLAPGSYLDFPFPDTVLGFGSYMVSCSTMLASDAVPANDRAEADFLVVSSFGSAEQVDVRIYTRAGEKVRQLSASVSPGSPPWIVWDRTNDRGERVAPGTYLCLVKAQLTDKSVVEATCHVLVNRDATAVRVTWSKP